MGVGGGCHKRKTKYGKFHVHVYLKLCDTYLSPFYEFEYPEIIYELINEYVKCFNINSKHSDKIEMHCALLVTY